jgi:hypothetical protein
MAYRTNAKGKKMRKLVVAVSAVAMVALGASVAQAQGTEKCPTPEDIKFEAPFTVGDSQDGITITAGGGNNVTFSIAQGTVVTQICVKAGNTAPVFFNFETDGSMTIGGITINYSCTPPSGGIVDNTGDGNRDLVGPCTVQVIGGGRGLGLSHVSFYTEPYVAPQAAVAPLVEAQSQGSSAAGGLAFTGAQISIMLVILVGLIAAGTLAWTAARRRAAKTD